MALNCLFLPRYIQYTVCVVVLIGSDGVLVESYAHPSLGLGWAVQFVHWVGITFHDQNKVLSDCSHKLESQMPSSE